MKIRGLAIAGGLLLTLAAPVAANAYQTVTTGTVNMRAAATSSSPRIATLRPGTSVWVSYCRRSWCLASTRGIKGWVFARYLAGTGYAYRPVYPPAVYLPPVIGLGLGYSFYDDDYHHYHHGKKWKWKDHDGKWNGKWKGGKWKGGGCPPWVCD